LDCIQKSIADPIAVCAVPAVDFGAAKLGRSEPQRNILGPAAMSFILPAGRAQVGSRRCPAFLSEPLHRSGPARSNMRAAARRCSRSPGSASRGRQSGPPIDPPPTAPGGLLDRPRRRPNRDQDRTSVQQCRAQIFPGVLTVKRLCRSGRVGSGCAKQIRSSSHRRRRSLPGAPPGVLTRGLKRRTRNVLSGGFG
jgi:hypothetical protein